MSSFQSWLKKRIVRENLSDVSNRADGFGFGKTTDHEAEDYERVQQELFKLVLNKYPDETMEFLNGIGQRGDQEISELLSKLRTSNQPTNFPKPEHPEAQDKVVVTPMADRSHDNSNSL